MKEFDLEAAKAGAPVCTRDGRKARIICFDLNDNFYPIVAAVTETNGSETTDSYTPDGEFILNNGIDERDLMMVAETTKHEGWVRLVPNEDEPGYFAQIYPTEEGARAQCKRHDFVAHIEWEE